MPEKQLDIAARIRRIETDFGKPVLLRPVHPEFPGFRGRAAERRDCFVIEYRDDNVGFFWHHDIVRELLACIEERRGKSVTLYDGDVQYVEVPLRRARNGQRPPDRP